MGGLAGYALSASRDAVWMSPLWVRAHPRRGFEEAEAEREQPQKYGWAPSARAHRPCLFHLYEPWVGVHGRHPTLGRGEGTGPAQPAALHTGQKGTGWAPNEGPVRPSGQLGWALSPDSLSAAAHPGRVGGIWVHTAPREPGWNTGRAEGAQGRAPIGRLRGGAAPGQHGVCWPAAQPGQPGLGGSQRGQPEEPKARDVAAVDVWTRRLGGGRGKGWSGLHSGRSPGGAALWDAHPRPAAPCQAPLLSGSLRSEQLSAFSMEPHYNHRSAAL